MFGPFLGYKVACKSIKEKLLILSQLFNLLLVFFLFKIVMTAFKVSYGNIKLGEHSLIILLMASCCCGKYSS